MGSTQSSLAGEASTTEAVAVSAAARRKPIAGGRGRESPIPESAGCEEDGAFVFLDAKEEESEEEEFELGDDGGATEATAEESEEEWDSDDGEEEEEEEEDEADPLERLRHLADARALGELASLFLHPERPASEDPASLGRCYFSRASAPEREGEDADEERVASLADAAALENVAADYLHPERPVEVAPAALGRDYFGRASAPEREDEDDDDGAEECAAGLADAATLKRLAVDFAHPERPAEVDPAAFGRDYFGRDSAPEREDEDGDDAVERALALADAAALKGLAVNYAHPEEPVKVDPAAFGRDYFGRASAPEREDAEERAAALADAAALKELAVEFAHPEKPVEVGPAAFGRDYFGRASAPKREGDDDDDAEECASALADAAALKSVATDYLHPERPVDVSPAAFGRGYFSRASAPEQVDAEYAEDRSAALAEAAALKDLAVDCARPEEPAGPSDPKLFGRGCFGRASAPAEEYEDEDRAAERAVALADSEALKKLAVDHAHPERPVEVGPAAFGRNYFGRAAAPPEQDEVDDEECAAALAEARFLKKLAVDHAHPERPIEVDSASFGCSYFNRTSAPEEVDKDHDEDGAAALADAKSLKKFAVDHAHPERSIEVDPDSFGRNYFNRTSAPEEEDKDHDEECAAALVDAKSLKKIAMDYAHPESPIEVDPATFGRNYFNRLSAPEQHGADEAEECTASLIDAHSLGMLAVGYAHPEKSVVVDPAAFGHNYFGGPSALEQENKDCAEEEAIALADAVALKKLAMDYAHPERPVKVDPTAFGRNFFDGASASQNLSREEAEEEAQVLVEAASLKKVAVDYAHPETLVETLDATATGRSYFDRPSSLGVNDVVTSTGVDERKSSFAAKNADGHGSHDDHFDFDNLHENLGAM